MRDLSHIWKIDGVEKMCGPVSLGKYTILFNKNHITKKDRDTYGFDANPWVWVIEFEQISKESALAEATF